MAKENDWIIATMNNPGLDVGEFQTLANMSLDNTLLLSKDYYLNITEVRNNDLFKNENGEFSEEKFNDFYRTQASRFQEFSTMEDTFQYGFWDSRRKHNSRVRDIGLVLSKAYNPDHETVGLTGIFETRPSNKSKRELALNSEIIDPETGKGVGYSLNDISLFNKPIEYIKSLFGDPIVYATYDKDTEEIDPTTGNKVKHYKGEFKVNSDGEYYTELLKGRSLIGKEVVSGADYLTDENGLLNSIDFLDSDDKLKSIGGNIAKGVFSILPLFIPYVRETYGAMLVTRELAKSLPMAYGIVKGLTDAEDVDNSTLNTIAGYASKFTTSSSDYSRENTYAFENFANLGVDVALQWSLQKVIAQGVLKLLGRSTKVLQNAENSAKKLYELKARELLSNPDMLKERVKSFIGIDDANDLGKILNSGFWAETKVGKAAIDKFLPAALKSLESTQKLGGDLSLVYMALISNTDVYSSIREISGNPQDAALIALGSTIGMFSVDKYLGLGEMFFEQDLSRKAIREATRQATREVVDEMGIQVGNTATKKGFLTALNKGITIGRRAVSNYFAKAKDHSLGFVGKSLGEGLEEVSEELVTDLTKNLAEVLGSHGIMFSQDEYGSWDNASGRYIMSFLGGSLGGAMFYGVDAYLNRGKKAAELQRGIIDLLRQGKKSELLKELQEQHKKGALGDTNLSFNTTEGADNLKVYLTADENNISLNDYVYNTLTKLVDLLDLILNSNLLNLSDDEVFDRMVQGEYRAEQLSSLLTDKDNFKNLSYVSHYLKDFKKITQDIADQEGKILNFISTTPDTQRHGAKYEAELRKLMDEKEELIKKKDFLFGEGSLGYVEKTLFAMDQDLAGMFFAVNFDQYVRSVWGMSAAMLENPALSGFKELIQKQYQLYRKEKEGKNLDMGFDEFKKLQKVLNPDIQLFTTLNVRESLEKLLLEVANLPIYGWDSKMDFETEAKYNDRNLREGETSELYNIRKKERWSKINLATIDKLKELSKGTLDRSTARRLIASLNILRPEAFNNVLENNSKSLLEQIKYSTEDVYGINANTIFDIISSNLRETNNIDDTTAIIDIIRKEMLDLLSHKYKELKWVEDANFLSIGQEYVTWQDIVDKINDMSQKISDADGFVDENYESFKNQFLEYASSKGISEIPDDKKIKIAYGFTNGLSPNLEQLNIIMLAAITNTSLQNAGILYKTENQINKDIQNFIKWKELTASIDSFIKKLHKDMYFETAYTLEKTATYKSPILPIILKLVADNLDLETFLSNIYLLYLSGLPSEFLLTDSLITSLKSILEAIQKLKIVTQAASSNESYLNPTGHNKMLNEFVRNHLDVYKNAEILPELDTDQSLLIFTELLNYETEIRAWIEKSEQNSLNRDNRLIKTLESYIKSILKFYTDNKSKFKLKFTVDDKTVEEDLLEGIDSLATESKWIDLVKVEELIHLNYLKLRNKGYSLEDIIKALLNTNVFNINNIVSGATSKLDETIMSNTITDYDKFIEIVSNFSDNLNINLSYFERLKAFITDSNNTNVAPLFAQEHAYKITNVAIQDKQLVKTALTAVQNLALKLNIIMPVIPATIITGVAGSGKTFANSRLVCNLGENTWLCGPDIQQVNGLKRNLPKGTTISGENTRIELLTKIFNSEAIAKQFLADIDSGKCPKNFKAVKGVDSNITFTLENNDNIAKIQNPPKNLVIDEVTHFSTPEILAISEFCDKNNINLILIGDDSQSGKSVVYKEQAYKNYTVFNADRECILAWRTPKLLISLRENNILKTHNLNLVLSPLHDLLYSNETTTLTIIDKILDGKDKPSITFKYNLGEELNGEYLTSGLNKELISKLKGKIGFIGDKSSPTYKELVDAGLDVEVYSENEVQGKEFAFAVVDIEWKKEFDSAAGLLNFYRLLYTMISRSQNGTIIIDNDISDIIQVVEDKTVGKLASISDSAKRLLDKQLPEIDEIITYIKSIKYPTILETKKQEEEILNPIIPPKIPPEVLDPEPKPINEPEEKDDAEKEEIKLEQQEEKDKAIKFGNIVRVYGNASYSGIDLDSNEVIDSDLDLGIFLTGTSLSLNKEERAKQIDSAVTNLLKLKGMFLYSLKQENGTLDYSYYLKYFNELKRKTGITAEELNNTKFYLVSKEPSQTTKLVGLTSLMLDDNIEEDKRAIGEGRKVITIEARITHGSKTYKITLGAVADPDTWLRADGSPIVLEYKKVINSFSEKEQEMEIEAPQFSAFLEIIPMETNDLEETKSRLASLDPTTKSLWQVRTLYAVVSPPVVLTIKDCQQLGLSESLSGKKSVVFVSNNLFLKPEELQNTYITNRQNYLAKNKLKTSTSVRMIVLSSVGVSFNSLCDNSFPVFNENITATIDDEGNKKVPFKLHGMAVRMYEAMWNFRADLLNYNEAYKKFLEKEFNDDEKELYKFLRLEDKYYLDYLLLNNVTYVNEKTFRDYLKLTLSDDVYLNLLKIWNFNEVTLKNFRRFRLGYSKDGAYIRNISGLDVDENGKVTSGPYTNSAGVKGIYITPKTAENYLTYIETIFTQIFDKAITLDASHRTRISRKDNDSWYKYLENKEAEENIEFNFGNGKKATITSKATLKNTIYALVSVAKTLYSNQATGNKFIIFPVKMGGKDISLTDITKSLFDGNTGQNIEFKTFPEEEGFEPFKIEENKPIGKVNKSFDNLMSLVFHGKLSRNVREGFEGNNQYDSLAEFPFGFFSDIMVVNGKKKGKNSNIYDSIYNLALLETDTVPAFPLFTVRFVSPKIKEEPPTPIITVTETITPEELTYIDKYPFLNIKNAKERIKLFKPILDSIELYDYIVSELTKVKRIPNKEKLLSTILNIINNRLKLIRESANTDYSISKLLQSVIEFTADNNYRIIPIYEKLSTLIPELNTINVLKESNIIPINSENNSANTYQIIDDLGNEIGKYIILIDENNELQVTKVLTPKVEENNGPITISMDQMINDVFNNVKPYDTDNSFDEDTLKITIQDIIDNIGGFNDEINDFEDIDTYKNTLSIIIKNALKDNFGIEVEDNTTILNNIKCNIQ